MPYGGNDWLALTPEPTLEPELPICDPHHHFWDFRTDAHSLPAVSAPRAGRRYPQRPQRAFTVFIEARAMYRADGPEEMRPVGEVEFVQGLAAASASGLYGPSRAAAAIVGHANLNLGERVAAGAGSVAGGQPQPVSGHPPFGDVGPPSRGGEHGRAQCEGQLASDQFRAGARVLARMGLSLEGWLYFPQLPELAAFRQGRPRPADHPEPYRRPAADRPVRQPGRRGAGDLAEAASPPWPRAPTSTSSSAGSACPAPGSTGMPATSPSARRSWRRRWRPS